MSESWLSERNCLVSLYAQRGKTAISVVGAPLLTTPLLSVYECVCVCICVFGFTFGSLYCCCCCLTQLKFSFQQSFTHSLIHSFTPVMLCTVQHTQRGAALPTNCSNCQLANMQNWPCISTIIIFIIVVLLWLLLLLCLCVLESCLA